MATLSFRRNTISQLKDAVANVVSDHESKVAIIWSAFKSRMGVTSSPVMHFNLADLIHSTVDLSALALPFLKEQIDAIIKLMPPDKAPGPGFNGLFMKKAWHIIKKDFYQLCSDFFVGKVNLESINNSFIILVPKQNSPECVNGYRPISLLNCSIKILTKILADRLQLMILQLVHANQYGFIRSRTIQDARSFEYIYQCHQSRR
jgi:hypothetical protein